MPSRIRSDRRQVAVLANTLGHLAAPAIPMAVSLFGGLFAGWCLNGSFCLCRFADFLCVFDREQYVVAKTVTTMDSAVDGNPVIVGACRQPELFVPGLELYRAVFHGQVLGQESHAGVRFTKIGFKTHDLEVVCIDPRAPPERNRDHRAIQAIDSDAAYLIIMLPEMNLPGKAAIYPAQPFTAHFKIRNEQRVENEHDRRQPGARNLRREHFCAHAAVAVLLDVQVLVL